MKIEVGEPFKTKDFLGKGCYTITLKYLDKTSTVSGKTIKDVYTKANYFYKYYQDKESML